MDGQGKMQWEPDGPGAIGKGSWFRLAPFLFVQSRIYNINLTLALSLIKKILDKAKPVC